MKRFTVHRDPAAPPPGFGLRQSSGAFEVTGTMLKAAQASRTPRRWRAFTLLELLVVIAIIGLLAALTAPVLNNFKPNYSASATAQLMDAISRGRQLAISQRTTVYMVFVPTNFLGDPAFSRLSNTEQLKAAKLYDKQLIGYNYVSLR